VASTVATERNIIIVSTLSSFIAVMFRRIGTIHAIRIPTQPAAFCGVGFGNEILPAARAAKMSSAVAAVCIADTQSGYGSAVMAALFTTSMQLEHITYVPTDASSSAPLPPCFFSPEGSPSREFTARRCCAMNRADRERSPSVSYWFFSLSSPAMLTNQSRPPAPPAVSRL